VIYELRFMIYDLKAEARVMTTRVKPKPDSAQAVRQTALGVILRALRAMTGFRQAARQKEFPVPARYAKQSQFRQRVERVKCLPENKANAGRRWVGRAPGVLYKQTQFPADVRNKANVRQDKLGKEDVHGYVLNGNLL
jgi:hypothetical protein